MNNKGQAIFSEYVMIFFAVIAAGVAMTTFIQRGLEARIHDEKTYIFSAVAKSGACDANCLQATGGKISGEYEPYYAQMFSDVAHNEMENTGLTNGSALSTGDIYGKVSNEQTNTISTSVQLPPECADGVNPKPSYCSSPSFL